MKLSHHASKRAQQRGILSSHIEVIAQFGTLVRKPGGAVEYRLLDKDRKRLIHILDKVVHKAILVSDDGETVITVYNQR